MSMYAPVYTTSLSLSGAAEPGARLPRRILYLDIIDDVGNTLRHDPERGYGMKKLLMMALLLCPAAMPAEPFRPWDADVATGDERFNAGEGGIRHGGSAAEGVYDAFTGGSLLLIRFFQIAISPQDGPSCRFSPTCSAYGIAAVRKYGAFLGAVLAGDRILRCNQFGRTGHDPVPDHIFGDE